MCALRCCTIAPAPWPTIGLAAQVRASLGHASVWYSQSVYMQLVHVKRLFIKTISRCNPVTIRQPISSTRARCSQTKVFALWMDIELGKTRFV